MYKHKSGISLDHLHDRINYMPVNLYGSESEEFGYLRFFFPQLMLGN